MTWRVLPHRDERAHLWREMTTCTGEGRVIGGVKSACGLIDYTSQEYPLVEDEKAVKCRECVRRMRK